MAFDLLRETREDIQKLEKALVEHPAVKACTVIARQKDTPEQDLIAFIVPSSQFSRHSQLWQLMYIEQNGQLTPLRYCVLPNGLLIAYEDPFATIVLYTELFWSKIHLRHGITVADNDCVMDVGANIGLFTLLVHQQCRNIRVLAFEPGPTTYEILCRNGKLHNVNLKAFKCGLGDKTKTAPFVFFPNISGISGFYWRTDQPAGDESKNTLSQLVPEDKEGKFSASLFNHETYVCELKSLSDVLQEEHIECVNLLKVDTEKSEFDVLMGIREEDWSKVKQIVVEIHNGYLLHRVVELLQQHGYSIVVEVPEDFTQEEENLFKDSQYIVFARQRPPETKELPEVTYVPLRVSRATPSIRTGVSSLFNTPLSPRKESDDSSETEISTYITPNELHTFLQSKLSSIPVPSLEFVLLRSLPLNSQKEVDRRILSLLSSSIHYEMGPGERSECILP